MSKKYSEIFPERGQSLSDMNSVLWSNGIYKTQDIEWYSKFKRFGTIGPNRALTGQKEYLFFTKPDLHLMDPHNNILNPELQGYPYFQELKERYPDVINQLQYHNTVGGKSSPFMTLLSNTVKSSLDLPSISTNTIDTPATIYGTAYNYRGWGYSSDEKIDFTLEFEDSKYLEVYNLVKAYEEYERLKHLGLVTPPNIEGDQSVKGKCFSYYIRNKILHDQFSVYKFIVEDDGETIVYYAKLWGVFFKNVPREAFTDVKTEGGLSYSIEFEAAFVEDMNPSILTDFNSLVFDKAKTLQPLPLYNTDKRMMDGRWASLPVVTKILVNDPDPSKKIDWLGPKKMNHIYKLRWRR